MNVFVARHGETDWNVEARYQGQRESHLTPRGYRQARALAEAPGLQRARRIVSSPLERALETARPLAHRLRVPVETDRKLLEIAHGTWEGRLRDEIAAHDPERWRFWRDRPDTVVFPGGESLGAVRERWRTFTATLDGDDDVVVVTHDVLVRVALLDATKQPLARLWQTNVVNGGYAHFGISQGCWTVVEACVDAHLGTLACDPAAQAL